jgi:hypothetical protein
LSLEEIKKRLSQKLMNQCALEIKDLKLYHQVQLQQRHNFYFSPVASSECNSDTEKSEGENQKYKKKKFEENQGAEENNQNIGNLKMEPQSNAKWSNFQNVRIISPFNKTFTCNCKRSKCIKNYCACRINNEMCDESCQCQGCQNYTFFTVPMK